MIRQRLDRLRDGEGGVVVITGEAGLGKSRLIAEARPRPEQEGISWREGRTLSFGRTFSYWPVLEIIQQDAGIDSDDPEAERWAKLGRPADGPLRGGDAEILPYLATLLSLPVPEDLAHKVRYLDGEAMGRQIYRATRRYFTRLARERPTVVVFEDVHWLDGSSAALLEHLLPLTRRCPSSSVWSAARGRTPPSPGCRACQGDYADRLTEIALGPSPPRRARPWSATWCTWRSFPARLRDAILAKAEGNPFFVEEVVRSLIDLGGLVRDERPGLGG